MMNENTTRESAVCAMKEGNAFLDSRDDEHALESFRRAAELYGQLGDRKRQADALNLTAGILVRLDRADEAITALSGVIDLLGEEPLSRMRGMALSNRGLILARQKQYQDALAQRKAAIDAATKARDALNDRINVRKQRMKDLKQNIPRLINQGKIPSNTDMVNMFKSVIR